MEPIVSICIPTYNGARWLNDCMQSALACTVPSEIILVDDGSSDETVNMARALAEKHSNISVFVNENNLGLVANWNRCLEIAKGKWIKFLFQDDQLQPGSVEKMIEAAGDNYPFVAAKRNFVISEKSSAAARKFYTETVTTLDKIAPGETVFSAEKIVALAAVNPSVNFIGEPSTVLFRRSLITEIGNFDLKLKQICDLEYWIRIASRYGLLYVPEAQIDFGVHEDSASAQNAGGRKFNSTYLDPLRMVDAQLKDEVYASFRKNLQPAAEKRLRLWLGIRAYEARKNANDLQSKRELEVLFIERPHLRWLSGKMKNRMLFWILKMKRKFS